jgi:hypothetical protein
MWGYINICIFSNFFEEPIASEMLVSVYQTTRRHMSEVRDLNLHRRENLKFKALIIAWRN